MNHSQICPTAALNLFNFLVVLSQVFPGFNYPWKDMVQAVQVRTKHPSRQTPLAVEGIILFDDVDELEEEA